MNPYDNVIPGRRDQAFPVLGEADIARIEPFGERRQYRRGERLFGAGERTPGIFLVLKGALTMSAPHGVHCHPTVMRGQLRFELARSVAAASLCLVPTHIRCSAVNRQLIGTRCRHPKGFLHADSHPAVVELLAKNENEIVALVRNSSESPEAWLGSLAEAANRATDIATLIIDARDRVAIALNIPVPEDDDDGPAGGGEAA